MLLFLTMNSLLWQDVQVKAKPARKIKKLSISSNSDEGLGDLSFGPCSSLLPDIPPALARPTHNLKQVSRIFLDIRNSTRSEVSRQPGRICRPGRCGISVRTAA